MISRTTFPSGFVKTKKQQKNVITVSSIFIVHLMK